MTCLWWRLFVSIYWVSIHIRSKKTQSFRRRSLFFGLRLLLNRKPIDFWRRPFIWSSLTSLIEGWHHERCVTHTGWHHTLPPRVSPSLATPLIVKIKNSVQYKNILTRYLLQNFFDCSCRWAQIFQQDFAFCHCLKKMQIFLRNRVNGFGLAFYTPSLNLVENVLAIASEKNCKCASPQNLCLLKP